MDKVFKTIQPMVLPYTVLTFLLTLPLLINGHIHLLGDDSAGLALWSTWWPGYAITHNYDLVYNHFTLFPINTNLLPVLSLITSVFFGILNPIFGSLLAYNLLLPLYIILNALCTFAYLRQHTGSILSAAIGGAIMALNPITYELAQHGDIGLMGFFVIPLWLILWDSFIAKPTLKRAFVMGIGLYGIIVTSLQFWPFICTLLLPYALYRWQHVENRKPYIDALLPSILAFAALIFIYPVPAILWSNILPIYAPLSIWQGAGSPDLIAWLFLAAGARLVVWAFQRTPSNQMRFLWLGIIALNLTVYLLPTVSPLVFLGIVSPNNLGRPLVLWLPIILAALVITLPSFDLDTRFNSTWLTMGVILVALSGWWQPLPTSSAPYSSFDQAIAADPEDYLIASFPAGIDTLQHRAQSALDHSSNDNTSFGISDFAGHILLDSALDHKPVLGGLTTALRPGELGVYASHSLLQLLGGQPLRAGSRQAAQQIREDTATWRIGYIIAHLDQLSPDFINSLHQWLIWTNAYCLAAVEGDREFWRATWHPAGCPPLTLRLGDPNTIMALDENWYAEERWGDQPVRWAGRQTESAITTWLTPHSDYSLRVRATAPQNEKQTLEILVNGKTVGEAHLQKDWQDYTFSISRELIPSDGFVTILLRHGELSDVEGRSLTAAYDYLTLQQVQPS